MIKIKEIQFISINDKETIIVNLINGLADVIDKDTEKNLKNNQFTSLDDSVIHCLKDRKYIFSTKEEYDIYLNNIYYTASFYEERETPNFLFIPSYDCNLNCTYCYQKAYKIQSFDISEDIVESFFDYIQSKIKDLEKRYKTHYEANDIIITLMGGEPLLSRNKYIIKEFVKKCQLYGYKYDIVTNGITIKEYIDVINTLSLQSIQIALDGDKKIHDSRRISKNKIGTFDIIMDSIQLLVLHKVNVQLRINVDKDNIYNLPLLAEQLHDFFDNPYFYAYIFLLEHEGCMEYKNVIPDYIALKKIYDLQKQHMLLKKIDIAYVGKELVDGIFSNETYYPTTRKCSSSKNQYIFDLYKNVFKCWWGIGNDVYKINKENEELVDSLWKKRQTLNINQCRLCNYRYLCGGGCVGRNMHNNTISCQKGECHNFKEILEIAIKEEYNDRI